MPTTCGNALYELGLTPYIVVAGIALIERFHQMGWRPGIVKLLLVAFVWSASGCSDTFVDPFLNDGKYFTVYGFLDELESAHSLWFTA